jgi:hypothetical protein
MGKFLFNNLEYVVGITSAAIGITAFFIRLKKPVKNYGNLTPLVIKHKKMQQAIAPSKKLF